MRSLSLAASERRVAKQLGVTPAGLAFLTSLAATGAASQRGTEPATLLDAGLIAPNPDIPDGPDRVNPEWSRRWFVITDAGRDIVRRARAMGW